VNLCALLGIAVLEGNCVAEPLDERDASELCAEEILVALFLVELRKNMLKDVVETTAFTTAKLSGKGS
jgi:hypothetical protein